MSQDLNEYNIRQYFPQVNETDSDDGIVKDYLLASIGSEGGGTQKKGKDNEPPQTKG